jgi:hypothetical protein
MALRCRSHVCCWLIVVTSFTRSQTTIDTNDEDVDINDGHTPLHCRLQGSAPLLSTIVCVVGCCNDNMFLLRCNQFQYWYCSIVVISCYDDNEGDNDDDVPVVVWLLLLLCG